VTSLDHRQVLTAGTSKVLPLEQKTRILIQPKRAKAGAACIAYSAKIKEKIQVVWDRFEIALQESSQEKNSCEIRQKIDTQVPTKNFIS